MHVSNLFYNEPNVTLAARLCDRSFGESVFFCNSGRRGQRGRDQARAQAPAARRPRGGLERRSTAARTARCRATPQESKQAPFAPLVPGFRAVDASEVAAAVDENTAAVLIEPIQGESGVNVMLGRAAGVDPRRVRRGRRRAGVRRGPDRHGADRIAVGVRAAGGRAGRDDAGQGPGRRTTDRCARHRPEAAEHVRPRRPRLDVRGRARGERGGERRAGHHRRRGVPRARARGRRAARWSGCWSCPAWFRPVGGG